MHTHKKKRKQNIRTNILLSISKIRRITSNITYYQSYFSAARIRRATIRAKKNNLHLDAHKMINL